MDTRYISFPSKTFLIGEYAVLEGAPSILINTHPRFWFSIVKKKNNGEGTVFHFDSAAGQWMKKHEEITQNYHIKTIDPHGGKGGFGLSSAQFDLVYLLSLILKKCSLVETDLSQMWRSYRKLQFEGYKPGGADIVSQWVGGVCLFTCEPFSVRSITWPFLHLDFLLVRTGATLKTWEYLTDLSSRGEWPELSRIAREAMNAMDQFDRDAFVSAVKEYSDRLANLRLVHEATNKLLKKIDGISSVIVAKGCGAMGAEVVCVFFDPKNREEIKLALKEETIVADSSQLTYGMNEHEKEELEKDHPILRTKTKDKTKPEDHFKL